MGLMNIRDRNAGLAAWQEQVWGFSRATGIDSQSYLAPGAHVIYVDPNNAQATDAGNLGRDPTVPLATVARAITLCRDHQGDTIVVGANDAWNYAPQTYRPTIIQESVTIPLNRGGIRIVGAAPNPFGVCWEPANDSEAAITVHAIDVLIEGICFYTPDVSSCTGILAEWDSTASHYGENLTVRNCVFSSPLDYGIDLDYTWYCQIYNCYFEAVTAGIRDLSVEGDPDYLVVANNKFNGCVEAMALDSTDEMVITGNYIADCPTGISMDNSTDSVVNGNFINTTIGSGTVAIDGEGATDCVIHGNVIVGDPTGTRNFIDLTGGATNMVSDNWLSCTLAQYAAPNTCADGAADVWVNNHCQDGDTVANP